MVEDPDNNVLLTATAVFGGIDVQWTFPMLNPHAVAHVRLYRNTSGDFNSAQLLSIEGGNFFHDRHVIVTPTQYWYWIEIVSVNNTVGAPVGPATATAGSTVEDLQALLANQLTTDEMALALKARLDQIETTAAGLAQELLDRDAGDVYLGSAIASTLAHSEETRDLLLAEVLARETGESSVGTALSAPVTNAKLADMATQTIKARKTAGTGDPEDCSLSEVLDFIGSASHGDMLYRGASGWARLAAGTAGQVLTSAGAAAPVWASPGGKQMLMIPAKDLTPRAVNGCGALTVGAGAANQPDYSYLPFDAATAESAEFMIPMPKAWNEGTISFQPIWMHPTTTTDFGVVWRLDAMAISDAELLTATYTNGLFSIDTGGAADTVYIGPESNPITVSSSPVEKDILLCRIVRAATHASDTMTVDAWLLGLRLYFTTNAKDET